MAMYNPQTGDQTIIVKLEYTFKKKSNAFSNMYSKVHFVISAHKIEAIIKTSI